MSEQVSLFVDGVPVSVTPGSVIAVAVIAAGLACRHSVTGQPRAPLCGIGICFECRVTINGEPHCRSCQVIAETGMDIRTDA